MNGGLRWGRTFSALYLSISHVFIFSTSFKLIRLATSSLARHAIDFTDRKTLSEAVTLDLGNISNVFFYDN